MKMQILEHYNITGGGTAMVYLNDKQYLNFGGNNYLALNQRPELKAAAQRQLDNSSGFSMHLPRAYGSKEAAFESVEQEAALFFGKEAAVYLPSGYFLGHAALTGLTPKYDAVMLDELAHWCMWDAAKLSEKPVYSFKHCDVQDLKRILADQPANVRPLIGTDGAFATMGNIPPIKEYAKLAEERNGVVFVDESHAVGVVGENGRGASEYCRAGKNVHIAATLSKGICGQGAVFVGDNETIERAATSTVLRGSSKGSPISAAVSAAALRLIRNNPTLISSLKAKSNQFRERLKALGLTIEDSPTSIVSFSLGNFELNRALQKHLFENKIYILHSNYIAAGEAGAIRLSIFADHTLQNVNTLVLEIQRFLEENI